MIRHLEGSQALQAFRSTAWGEQVIIYAPPPTPANPHHTPGVSHPTTPAWGAALSRDRPGLQVSCSVVMQVGSSPFTVEMVAVPVCPSCAIVSVASMPRGTQMPMNPLS